MDQALAGIITALVSGLCVAIPTIVATITSNKAHDKVIDEKTCRARLKSTMSLMTG